MKHIRFNLRKTIIFLAFYSIAALLFSQATMQLLTTIESPFATDTFNWGSKIKGGGDINGDLNGDGYCDLVISDSVYGYEGEDDWGRVYIYFGGPDFSTTPDVILDGQDYMGSHRGNLCFGYKIDISGDFNGDGINDLVVSSAHADLAHYGQADIFFGSPDFDTESDRAYYGELCEEFASSFTVGDINGDGFSDLATMSTYYGYHTDGVMQELKIFLGGDMILTPKQMRLMSLNKIIHSQL